MRALQWTQRGAHGTKRRDREPNANVFPQFGHVRDEKIQLVTRNAAM
jgi:hypothetical protein